MLNRNPQNNLNDLYRTAFHLLPQQVLASAAVEETFLRARIAFGEHPRFTNSRTRLFQILIQVIRLKQTKSSSSAVSAISRIPLHFREALLLVDGQGFSYSDTARILGLSEDAVARHITQGRNHLQSEMEMERKCV